MAHQHRQRLSDLTVLSRPGTQPCSVDIAKRYLDVRRVFIDRIHRIAVVVDNYHGQGVITSVAP